MNMKKRKIAVGKDEWKIKKEKIGIA